MTVRTVAVTIHLQQTLFRHFPPFKKKHSGDF